MKNRGFYITVNERAISVNSMYGRKGSRSFLTNEATNLQKAIRNAVEEKYGYDYEQYENKVMIKIMVEKATNKEFDLDNCAKLVIDGIVKAGVIVDDDLVYELYMKKGIGKVDCIRVKIEEIVFQEVL